MQLHPANRLALWFWLASLLPWLERQFLYGVAASLLGLTLIFARARFLRALPRMRWLLLALGAIYGWTSPGEYLWSGWFSPTYEGLQLGLAQTMRLLAIAASLQLLLTKLDRPAIFAGLHTLAKPLDWLGLSRDRMALRLTLTLEMMENLLETRQPIKQLMHELHTPLQQHVVREVQLPILPISPIQQGILGLQLIGAGMTLWLGGFGAWA